jgi:hypothetical protein
MDALEVETSLAEGEQALQTRLTFVRERAGTREAHDAETGIFKRLLPIGWAALKLYVAPRGPGDLGAAVPRADGMRLPRETPRRARDDCSLFGTGAGPRTCDRTPGEPGIFPLDAPVNFPERGSSYFLQEWMTVFAVEQPFQERAGLFEQLFDLEVAESVLMEVAKEAPQDYERCDAQQPVPDLATQGEFLVVSFDGQGVPMIKAEATKLKAKVGTGETRQQKKEALVGVSYTVDAKLRSPEAWAERLVEPEAARARRQREGATDDAPRAQHVRRVASLVRTKPAVMELMKAEAERRDPGHRQPLVVRRDGALGLWNLAPKRFKPWKRMTCILDILPVGGDLWSAANAWCGEGSKDGTCWVQAKLTAILRGRVGDVVGGLRQILTKPRRRKSVRETLAKVVTFCHNHRRWMQYDVYLAAGLPVGTGVVESACGSVVKHRMEGEGKRWSLAGAAAILALRSLTKSHDHDLRDDWRFRARQVRVRLYGGQPTYRPMPPLRRVA